MSVGREQAWAAGSRHSAWTLPDALRSNSSQRHRPRDSFDAQSDRQEEHLDDYEQLVRAALEDIPESRRSMVRHLVAMPHQSSHLDVSRK